MIIKLEPFDNGAHANQSTTPPSIPDGWAKVRDGVEIPESFPYVDLVLDEKGIVVALKPREIPDFTEEPETTPVDTEQLRADIDYISIMTGVELT